MIIFAAATAAAGIGAAAIFEVKAGYYECPHCKELFVPTMSEYIKGYHTFTKGLLNNAFLTLHHFDKYLTENKISLPIRLFETLSKIRKLSQLTTPFLNVKMYFR